MAVPLYNTNIRLVFILDKKNRFTKTRPYEIVWLQLKRFGFFKNGSEGIHIYLKKKQELCITVKYILMVDFLIKRIYVVLDPPLKSLLIILKPI